MAVVVAKKKPSEPKQEINLVKLIEEFGSEDKCREYLKELRWPNAIDCPRCAGKVISTIAKRNQYDCDSCRYQFSVTAGSIFHDSHLPLWKWFLTIYMMTESRKGVSANQVKRTLGVSYKTAWYLCHRIRAAMSEVSEPTLRGRIKVDETYIGGETTGKGRGYKGNKTIVVCVIERGGKIRLQVVKGRDRKSLHAFIKEHVAPDAEVIYTDDWAAYGGIADDDTRHETVNHSIKEYVRGDVHTNSIENVWSLLKRAVAGSYHNISAKHLDAYLDEMEWRFNNRDNAWLFRDTINKLINSGKLEYKELISV